MAVVFASTAIPSIRVFCAMSMVRYEVGATGFTGCLVYKAKTELRDEVDDGEKTDTQLGLGLPAAGRS